MKSYSDIEENVAAFDGCAVCNVLIAFVYAMALLVMGGFIVISIIFTAVLRTPSLLLAKRFWKIYFSRIRATLLGWRQRMQDVQEKHELKSPISPDRKSDDVLSASAEQNGKVHKYTGACTQNPLHEVQPLSPHTESINLPAPVEFARHDAVMEQHQLQHDATNEVPNRRMLTDMLTVEIIRETGVAGRVTLMYVGLDRNIGGNIRRAHVDNEKLQVCFVDRIRLNVHQSDKVVRVRDDEFAVVIAGEKDISYFGLMAEALVAELKEPFDLDGQMESVSASIGIASYPVDADCADKLMRCSCQAMFAAREAGRNGFCFYLGEHSSGGNERLELERDLQHGLACGEFELYFQPKVNLLDGSLLGSEALLRWNSPQHGIVQPDQFIRIAEESGLILELGEWVLREACRTACNWNGPNRPLHKVAINVSVQQFQSGDFLKTLDHILVETGCSPEWIELEIAGSVLLAERGDVQETLEVFQALGISIAIDDFGMGNSDLSCLARFPINTLNIDKSFIPHLSDGCHQTEVVKAIITSARSLNLQVVAKGVETPAQAAVLQGYGCHIGQGFLYCKPIAKSDFELLPLPFALV
jgi:diguanylate cyclase (GGDEF)-like protein